LWRGKEDKEGREEAETEKPIRNAFSLRSDSEAIDRLDCCRKIKKYIRRTGEGLSGWNACKYI